MERAPAILRYLTAVGRPDVDIAQGDKPLSETLDPRFTGIDHLSLTVTDLDASVAWYQRVFRTEYLDLTIPHYGREETG